MTASNPVSSPRVPRPFAQRPAQPSAPAARAPVAATAARAAVAQSAQGFALDDVPTTEYVALIKRAHDSGVHQRPDTGVIELPASDLLEVHDTVPSVVIDDVDFLEEVSVEAPVTPNASRLPASPVPLPRPLPSLARRPAAGRVAPPAVARTAVGAKPLPPLPAGRAFVSAPVVPISQGRALPQVPAPYAPHRPLPLPGPIPVPTGAETYATAQPFELRGADPKVRESVWAAWFSRLGDDATSSLALIAVVLFTGILTGLAVWLVAFR